MEIVALVTLGRSAEQEVPFLAADLGITPYEVGLLLRGALPVIVLRTEDRAKAADVAAKLRSRGHSVVQCDLASIVASDQLFRPSRFRVQSSELVGRGTTDERRLPFADIFALVRATHLLQREDMVASHERKVSLGRSAMTGGLMLSKVSRKETRRISSEREPVLYVFRSDSAPWLLALQHLRYDGLGRDMKRSKVENFEVLVRLLRELAPSAPYDARLVHVRAPTTIVSSGAKHVAMSTAATIDILAQVVATSLVRTTTPYR